MDSMRRVFSLSSTLFICLLLMATASLADDSKTEAAHTSGMATFPLKSKINDITYSLSVALPEKYATSNKRYPVVYVLDGQWNFQFIEAIAGKLRYDGAVPDLIVAGITWHDADVQTSRQRDFTAAKHQELPPSGGGEAFLRVLEKELIAYVDSHYRTNDHRTITGSSLGGSFVIYTLLQQPQLFDGYIASAPNPAFLPPGLMDKRLPRIASAIKDKTRVFISCGSLDGCVRPVEAMTAQLRAAKIRNVELETRIVPDLSHAGVEPIAYTYGLANIFAREPVPVAKQVLESYTGKFRAENGVELEFALVGDELVFRLDGNTSRLVAVSEHEFYVHGFDASVRFQAEDGRVDQALATSYGIDFTLTRVAAPQADPLISD